MGAIAGSDQTEHRFPDFAYLPANYGGEVFKLRQDFPSVRLLDQTLPAFVNIDFKTDWKRYVLAARELPDESCCARKPFALRC